MKRLKKMLLDWLLEDVYADLDEMRSDIKDAQDAADDASWQAERANDSILDIEERVDVLEEAE